MQRTTAPPKLVSTPAPPVLVATTGTTIPANKESFDQFDDEKEFENYGLGHGVKIISKSALDNIHKESTSINFNFDEKKDEKSPFLIGPIQSRQIGVIRPQPKSPIISSDNKVVILEDATSKDDVDSISKKEELLVSPSNAVSLGFSKTQPKSEPAQTQTTTKPVSPPVFSSKSQTAGRTKQITTVAGPTASKSEPVILTDAQPSSPTTLVPTSISTSSLVDKKAAETAIVVSVPMIKALSPSSQITKTSNSTPVSTTAIIGAHSPSSGAAREQQNKKWHPHQSETTTVFNFVNDTSRKTDHIRNEGGSTGILVYKVIL
jgi:hypothetical protein